MLEVTTGSIIVVVAGVLLCLAGWQLFRVSTYFVEVYSISTGISGPAHKLLSVSCVQLVLKRQPSNRSVQLLRKLSG